MYSYVRERASTREKEGERIQRELEKEEEKEDGRDWDERMSREVKAVSNKGEKQEKINCRKRGTGRTNDHASYHNTTLLYLVDIS